MKTIQRKTILLLVLLAGFGITSCDLTGLTDAVDDFGVIIGLEPIDTNATVQLVDASTGELIDSNITVDFGGTNGGDVIDIYSDPLPEDEVGDGILNFGIANRVTPSESNPAEIKLILQASGYVTTSKTISINSEGSNDFSIKMVRENNKPEGVKTTSNSEGTSDDQGTVQTDFSASSDSDSDTEAGASVDVTSGTVFKDESGNNLTGQLTTSLSYYTPSEVTAMSSLPVDLVDDEGNQIVVAGASQVSVTDSNGRRATTAEATAKSNSTNGPLSYTFKIPSSVINPMAGRPYNEGDPAIIFIFDTSFNVTIENGTVEALEAGGLGVRYNSSVVPLISVTGNPLLATASSCSANVTLNRNGNNGALNGRVFTSGFVSEFRIPEGSSQYTIPQVPGGEMTVEVETPSGEIVNQTVNICNQGGLTVDLPAPTAPVIDATIDVNLECANPNEKITVTSIPSASILYRLSGEAGQGRSWRSASNIDWSQDTSDNNRITGGSFDVSSVVEGEDYDFTVKIDTEKRTKAINISGENVSYTETINSGICSN